MGGLIKRRSTSIGDMIYKGSNDGGERYAPPVPLILRRAQQSRCSSCNYAQHYRTIRKRNQRALGARTISSTAEYPPGNASTCTYKEAKNQWNQNKKCQMNKIRKEEVRRELVQRRVSTSHKSRNSTMAHGWALVEEYGYIKWGGKGEKERIKMLQFLSCFISIRLVCRKKCHSRARLRSKEITRPETRLRSGSKL